MAVIILSLGLVIANNSVVGAILPYAISPEEMRRLPPYCVARMQMSQDSLEAKAWRGKIGENFVDYFHYCAGLNFINRYWGARTADDRNYYLKEAKGEFDYIAQRLKPDFTMGAELYSNRAEVLSLMGKVGEAIIDLNKALSINPKMVKPYLQLANLYEKAKDRTRSLGVVTEGLKHVPDSKALQRRYTELGGKLPYPEPIQTTTVEAAQPVATPDKKIEAPSASEKTANDTPASPPVVVPDDAAQTKIGSPKNPYCRFCAD